MGEPSVERKFLRLLGKKEGVRKVLSNLTQWKSLGGRGLPAGMYLKEKWSNAPP